MMDRTNLVLETTRAGWKLDTIAYAWFVWEKGYEGKPTIGWITA